MRILIVGIGGSMGQRRCRNLQALGYTDIIGYDINTEAAIKAAAKYNIQYTQELSGLWNNKPDVMIVSVPPLLKQKYIDFGNSEGIDVFCEADVTEYTGTYYPSATMRFHLAIQKMKECIDRGDIGEIRTFTYHCGNHIEDWHPGANKKTYYAMSKEAGGCKEIFPFELSWLSHLFGTPIYCIGTIDKKLNDPDITADDVYATVCIFDKHVYPMSKYNEAFGLISIDKHIIGTILIDIVSRPAIRELRIVGSKANLLWNWDDDNIRLEYPDGEISMIFYPKGSAADGYNKNIPEFMYEQEIKNFLEAIQGKAEYLYSREEEEACIEMLRKVEGI